MNTSIHHGPFAGWSHIGVRSLIGALVLVPLVVGCNSSNDDSTPAAAPVTGVSGQVLGNGGEILAGATVYLVPAYEIDFTPITPANILSRVAEDFDEPLEDFVAASGATMQQDDTDAAGDFVIDPVADGRYYVFVKPAAGDVEHIPGGSECRDSYDADEIRGMDLAITMSSSPPAAAQYVGMSSCLSCHADYDGEKMLAHRLGFRAPGVSSVLQDDSYHPELDDGLEFFLPAADYTGGTPVYHYDFDPSRGFDKFKTALTDPAGSGGVVSVILWLWQDTADDSYKITFDNQINPGTDPLQLMERDVALTYGGAVQKQRYMISWPGLNGLYPVLQYQTVGADAIYDRTRKSFRDYHLDFFWDAGTDTFKAPAITKNIQVNCMGCHAAGYEQYVDGATGERLCDTIEDPNGEYDIDGDGFINDLNTGCEACHGPGSEHVLQNGADGRFIIAPEYMTASRENQICARCHDRQVGAGTVQNDHPLDVNDKWPLPGISRADYLTQHTTRPGPKSSDYWVDFDHSKSHHQQGPDMVRSAHYRNPYELVTCMSCHNMHEPSGFPRSLVADPDAADSALCQDCHQEFLGTTAEHTQDVLGVAHGGFVASCVDCHMGKTAKTGAGEYGFLMAAPTGDSTDADTTYFQNDISSHTFDVPSKHSVGVQGVTPGSAMPVPYTNRCGTCHDPSTLPF